MGEVPDAVSPVLQIHVAQLAPGPTSNSMPPQCSAGSLSACRWPFRTAAWPRRRLRASPACGPNRRRGRSGPRACATADRPRRRAAHTAPCLPDQQAACSAANLSKCGFIARNRCLRISSPCSATSASRLPNSTPRSAHCWSKRDRDRPAVERDRRAGQFDAVRQQRVGQLPRSARRFARSGI